MHIRSAERHPSQATETIRIGTFAVTRYTNGALEFKDGTGTRRVINDLNASALFDELSYGISRFKADNENAGQHQTPTAHLLHTLREQREQIEALQAELGRLKR